MRTVVAQLYTYIDVYLVLFTTLIEDEGWLICRERERESYTDRDRDIPEAVSTRRATKAILIVLIIFVMQLC